MERYPSDMGKNDIYRADDWKKSYDLKHNTSFNAKTNINHIITGR